MSKAAQPAPALFMADWPAAEHIIAFTTYREGGVSLPPFDSFNMGDHVGDQPTAVQLNRRRLLNHCQGLETIQWLQQLHGTAVATAGEQQLPAADACFTRDAGIACAVMTADCLPILLCDRHGDQIAAVHAGWRGLVAGVIENTIASFDARSELMAWLGPAISQPHFEVGVEVRQKFLATATAAEQNRTALAFVANADRPGFYFADLYQLARLRLQQLGVNEIYGGNTCSYTNEDRFFSYRRDGECGRMVSVIYKKLI